MTNLVVVAVAVYQGPPKGTQSSLTSPPAFLTDRGYAQLEEVQSSRLLTMTRATLLESPTRLGSTSNTIEVPRAEPGFRIDNAAIRAFMARNDSYGLEITPQMLDSKLQRSPAPKTLPCFRVEQFQVLNTSPFQTDLLADCPQANIVEEITLGFPFRAMWTADRSTYSSAPRIGVIHHGQTRWVSARISRPNFSKFIPPGFATDFGFPTGVIPLGFAANTTIYAAAWFALFSIPAFIRRRVAARRGLCRKCAYDLRGISAGAPCPECGAVRTLKSELRPSQMDPV